jgi:acetylornithine deacetylase/succinyl-diaminopimelate desuccinylase-like protein
VLEDRRCANIPVRVHVATAGLALLLGAPLASDGADVLAAVRSWRSANEVAILRDFAELLAIPNLASDAPGITRNAEAIRSRLAARGFAVRLLDGEGGPPPVYAELPARPDAPTLLVYVHYDGQPVDASQWNGDPWRPVLRDAPVERGGRAIPLESLRAPVDPEWRLYARSASDDKAPIAGLLAALDALRAARLPLAVNLKLFLEGEEEAGSPHLAAVLARNRERLAADLMLLCDGPVHQSRRMQLYFGARGVVDVEVTVYGPLRSLHSGHYGNWAPNPALLLAHLLAGLRDADGRILVGGFYDDVRPPSDAEKAALARIPDQDAALREALALAASEAGNARLAERVLLPALNLRGIQAGHTGEGAANAIPTEARASIDFRLVPDQTPQRVRERVEAHLRAQRFHIIEQEPDTALRRAHPRLARLVWGTGYPAARTALDLPIARRLIRVVEGAAEGGVILAPTLGGSIPMHLFAETLRLPVVGVPIANHDNNQHAADENIRIRNLWDGIEVYAAILAGFGAE